MSYRSELNNESGERELVIDGWEKGIADSPYTGITSLKNLNISWLNGATYVNYKRKAVTLSGGTMGIPKFYTQSPGTSPTYYILDDKGQVWSSSGGGSTWTLITGNHTSSGSLGYGIAYFKDYLFVFGSNYIDVCGDGTGVGHITSSYWANVNGSGYYFINLTGVSLTAAPIAPTAKVFTAALAAGATSGTFTVNWAGTTGVYQLTFSDGETRSNVTLTNGSAAASWVGGLTNAVTTAVTASSPYLTMSSTWAYASGIYQVVIGTAAQTVQATFTYGSPTIIVIPAISVSTAVTTITVSLFTPTSPVNHMALVSINDVLYFCNGNTIGSITVPPTNIGATFLVSDFSTQYVYFSALALRTTDRAVWLTEVTQNLLIAVKDYIYYWDKTSTLVLGFPFQSYTQTPINESPSRMINILNNVYIFAGQKGNIYISNGYSVSLFKKIPDSFLGVIDPYWVIGGMMFHRNKLWFGAVGSSNDGNTKVQGIFSLVLVGGSSSYAYETAGAINFENQNSYGSSPTLQADGTGILIDLNSNFGNGLGAGVNIPDVYQSAYYNNSVGGIDYNDTDLWANFEPAIETDLIPIGTILTGATLAQIEFKLDRPMASGDQIKMSYRTSFTGSYTLMGTTTTTVLSDIYDTGINAAQWVQFKVEFKCAASSSSFIPLREIRLHYGN